MTSVRAKFHCNSIEIYAGGAKTALLSAVHSSVGENKDFTDAPPFWQFGNLYK